CRYPSDATRRRAAASVGRTTRWPRPRGPSARSAARSSRRTTCVPTAASTRAAKSSPWRESRRPLDRRMKIAVDAMGGDFGPAVVVEGAVAASREFGLASVLVGDKTAVEREILRLRAQDLPLSVRHASQVVGMAESPSQALRRKRDSSLRVAAELV